MRDKTPPIKRFSIKHEDKKPAFEDGAKWICEGCGKDVFGIFRDGVLFVKYKERYMSISGVVSVPCRGCRMVNRIDTRAQGIEVNIVSSQEVDLD